MQDTSLRTLAAAALIALAASTAASAQTRGGMTSPGPAASMPGPTSPQSAPAVPSQSSPSSSSSSNASSSQGANTGSATNTSATAPLAAGMAVKDNTGATVGQINAVNPNGTGGSMVTIKMGTDLFQVPAANLSVQDGAATINLTKAQIQAQVHPTK